MAIESRDITETFAVLGPELAVTPVAVSPTLYEELDARFRGFEGHTLISVHEFSEDWSTWERHPAGDEVVLLLSGRATMVVRTGAGDESVDLHEAGAFVVVPRGAWHTARTSGPARMLFVTPGAGTENRASP